MWNKKNFMNVFLISFHKKKIYVKRKKFLVTETKLIYLAHQKLYRNLMNILLADI